MNIQFDHKPLFLQVKEFYTAFRQPYFQGMDYQRILLRDRLFYEEYKETMDALSKINNPLLDTVKKSDVIDMLDGVADCLYIAYGTILEHYGDVSNEINSVIDTTWNPEGKERFISFNKTLWYRPPFSYIPITTSRLNYFLNAQLKKQDDYMPLIENSIKHLLNDVFNHFVANDYGYYFTYEEIYNAFDIVHQANMAKLDSNGNPILRADGKIIKPEGWQPPNLEQVLQWI